LLGEEGARFGFFQAVNLLHRLSDGAAPVGELGPPSAEPVRFRHDPDLIFHAGDVRSIERVPLREGGTRTVMTTTFLGLTGASSPMATVLAEEVLRAEAADEKTLRAFYDLLHHRLVSLFYRTWKKYRFGPSFRADASDPFSRKMLAFVGVDRDGAIPERGLRPLELLEVASLLGTRTRTARMLGTVLEHILPGKPVRVVPFVAQLVPFDSVILAGRNNTVSVNFVIGRTIIDRTGRARVVIGPVDQETFESLLPDGSRHARVREVIEQFLPPQVDAELVVLGEGDTSHFQLGGPKAATLGSSTWLRGKSSEGTMRARMVLGGGEVVAEVRRVEGGREPSFREDHALDDEG
jgi:type VI secretion system protein ImpH